ncbi:copper radical oxidase [Pholiota conissans]|uniref:Copper radical oxidase n=1 Tax=Pholiota conissans TaxID=109636 RepID=A0A9P5YQB6_9AGAR|nr:copper radical oxidase [Pholiota conissans]
MIIATQVSLGVSVILFSPISSALSLPVASPPGQPTHKGDAGTFEVIPDTIISAQQVFVGRSNRLYILDKVQNNPTQINGHPAWASEYRLGDNSQRPMEVVTNSFCAGGNSLGNGTWVSVGGNQAITTGGEPANTQDGSSGPYYDADGRRSIRMLNPCSGDECEWTISPSNMGQRWYPTVETLEDGSAIILGGCKFGGYVNDAAQSNPTFEFFPPAGHPITSNILLNTLPANLYPLTWLLPSGNLLVQAMWSTVLLNPKTHVEKALDDMPDAVRTYPASAGTVMMPLTPANNWTATVMFCGGSNIATEKWTNPDFVIISQPASTSCVKITPDVSPSYVQDDPLPVQRSMANFVLLPDGRILCINGAQTGTAGYGTNSWSIGQSYADTPVLTPVIYDPAIPAGRRWSSDGLSASTVPRMYHSTAILLPDGSVFVSGSNPNADYTSGPDVKYPTEYRTEKFYPSYFNQRRPQPRGLLAQLTYGGPAFDVLLDSDDLFGDAKNVVNTTVVVLRPGYSTHSMNMGQRMVVLDSTYTGYGNNTAFLHVSQMPPNPGIMAPGPAFLFVVVNGIPSIGIEVMVGSGVIEKQTILAVDSLPASSILQDDTTTNSGGSSGNGVPKPKSGAYPLGLGSQAEWFLVFLALGMASWAMYF